MRRWKADKTNSGVKTEYISWVFLLRTVLKEAQPTYYLGAGPPV
jgi:hypothetical protein